MIDLEKLIISFRLKWLGKIVDSSEGYWKEMSNVYFQSLGGLKLLLNCTIDINMINTYFVGKIPDFYVEILKAWVRLNMTNAHYSSIDSDKQILWYNKHVVFEKKPLFFKNWFSSQIIYLKNVCSDNTFITTSTLLENVRNKKSNVIVMFEYFRLQKAIPRVWMNNLKEPICLETPKVLIGENESLIQKVSSKSFYILLYNNENAIEGPSYWVNKLAFCVDWVHVYKRNVVQIKENKLRQFNFKVIYNLIPVKRKLFLWKLSNSDTCERCNCKEDLYHALLDCKMNEIFFRNFTQMVKHVYNINVEINIFTLLKIEIEDKINDIITIAFWSIYKMLVTRNQSGKDERSTKLWFTFLKEVYFRIQINDHLRKENKKELYHLPHIIKTYF